MVDACTAGAPPAVSSVAPDHGSNAGAGEVVITGSGFDGATQVLFGVDPVPFVVDADGQIRAQLGAVPTTGFVDVTVVDCAGSGTLAGGFDFFAPPVELGAPCGSVQLTWSGAPTLGETYTVTTQGLGLDPQLLLVDWSNAGVGPTARRSGRCFVLSADSTLSLGTTPSHDFPIPSDSGLIGVRLRVQALVRSTPRQATQVLEAVIGQ